MREALAFLTVLGGSRSPTSRALAWFPVVGLALGAAVGGVWLLGNELFAPAVAATLAVVADAALTGMLHLDGLADTADGVLPHAGRERRLEIMRTPGVGAFGIVTVVLALVLAVVALDARPADVGVVAAIWCASRTVVAVVPAWIPYARDDGIASAFVSGAISWLPALAVAPAVALAWITVGAEGAAAVVVTVVVALGVVWFARRRLDGFTGDVLGAAIVLGQVAGLVTASARW